MGCHSIFVVRIADTDAGLYKTLEVSKVLEQQEKEKKGKYL